MAFCFSQTGSSVFPHFKAESAINHEAPRGNRYLLSTCSTGGIKWSPHARSRDPKRTLGVDNLSSIYIFSFTTSSLSRARFLALSSRFELSAPPSNGDRTSSLSSFPLQYHRQQLLQQLPYIFHCYSSRPAQTHLLHRYSEFAPFKALI